MPFEFGLGGQKDSSKSKSKSKVDYWTPEQKQASSQLYRGIIMPGFKMNPYSGQPTNIEASALQRLGSYTGAQTPQVGQGYDALSRALTGQGYQNIVDPAAAERLYGAIENRTMQDILPKAITTAANQANLGGMLRSGTGMQLMTDEIGRVARALSEQLATLQYSDEQQRRNIERERESRQLQAIPGIGTMQSTEMGRILPGLQYGGTARDIAGTQFANPLNDLVLAYLGLRGQTKSKSKGKTDATSIGGKLGFELA